MYNAWCAVCPLTDQNVTHIYVMAHTTLNVKNAGSDGQHSFEIRVNNVNYTAPLDLGDLPGGKATRGKGDLWRLSMADFGIMNWYPTRNTIQSFAIVEDSNDGWLIDSIITILKYASAVGNSDQYEVATVDMERHQWVDGDGDTSRLRFDLNKIY